jgi:hypothetical protein
VAGSVCVVGCCGVMRCGTACIHNICVGWESAAVPLVHPPHLQHRIHASHPSLKTLRARVDAIKLREGRRVRVGPPWAVERGWAGWPWRYARRTIAAC